MSYNEWLSLMCSGLYLSLRVHVCMYVYVRVHSWASGSVQKYCYIIVTIIVSMENVRFNDAVFDVKPVCISWFRCVLFISMESLHKKINL